MSDINNVSLTGRLTRDPELRVTAGGTQLLSFTLAFNTSVRNRQTGEWDERGNFIDCTMFGKRAETLLNFLAKGQKVAIAGKLRYATWDKDGQRHSKLDLIVDEIDFMAPRRGGSQSAQATPAPQVPVPPIADDFDDDIPF